MAAMLTQKAILVLQAVAEALILTLSGMNVWRINSHATKGIDGRPHPVGASGRGKREKESPI